MRKLFTLTAHCKLFTVSECKRCVCQLEALIRIYDTSASSQAATKKREAFHAVLLAL